MQRARLLVAILALALAFSGLAYSAWRGLPQSWRAMDSEHDRFAAMPRAEREQAFGALVPMPMDLFAWYRDQLEPRDRYYVQGASGGFGQFADLRTTVRAVGRLYFLPAVEVDRPESADVIVTWGVDPADLGLRFCAQVRAGLQPFFVSRVRCGS